MDEVRVIARALARAGKENQLRNALVRNADAHAS